MYLVYCYSKVEKKLEVISVLRLFDIEVISLTFKLFSLVFNSRETSGIMFMLSCLCFAVVPVLLYL